MKTIKKLSREDKKSIKGGFTDIQIEACGGEQFVCLFVSAAEENGDAG